MLMGDIHDWNEQTNIIDPDDVIPHPRKPNASGIENECHITLLYGLHDDVTNDKVKEIIKNFLSTPIQVELSGLSCFSNDEYDVIKFDVESDILHQINAELKKLPYTTQFDEYHPHMTLAYVKKGAGEKYKQIFDQKPKLTMGKIVYSDVNKSKTNWNLGGFMRRLPSFEEFMNS